MWNQEKKHLDMFNELIIKYDVRPTLLRPVWEFLSFGLGATTALLGKEAAMACTEAVEEVVGNHYNNQLRELTARSLIRFDESNMMDEKTNPQDQGSMRASPFNESIKDVVQTIKVCRDEELHHLNTAVEHDAHQSPFYHILTNVIKFGCKGAIQIAQKI